MLQAQAIFINIFTILAVAFAVVLVYSLRSSPSEFIFSVWVKTNYNRFLAGGILGVIISILIVVSPDIEALFAIIGFNANRTPVSIGLALGALLVAAFSGIKQPKAPESEQPSEKPEDLPKL